MANQSNSYGGNDAAAADTEVDDVATGIEKEDEDKDENEDDNELEDLDEEGWSKTAAL